jgi:hypothetical protein
MKKILILFVAFSLVTTSFGSSGFSVLPKKASDVYLPIGSNGQKISVLDLSKINVKTFENISGRHLNFFDRLGFKLAQKKLKKSINADGTIDNKKLNKLLAEGETGFHLGGFALGFLVGLIGVLIAYLINDDKKKNRVKWAWIGFGVWIVILLLFII